MTKCKSCGSNISKGAKFCSNCGAAVTEAEEEIKVSSDELIAKIKELLHEGNVSRLLVKDEEGRTLLEVPAWAGIVGAVIAPWLAALGAVAALATDCTITIIRRE